MTRTLLAALVCAAPLAAAPVPKADADDVDKLLARVRVDGVGSALSQPTAAAGLNLSDDQRKKLDELGTETAKKAVAQYAGVKQRNANGSEDVLGSIASMLDASREFDEQAMKLFGPEQVRRLKQVQLQKEGPAGLLSRHAVRALRFTPEQEDELAAELAKAPKLPLLDEIVAMCEPGGLGNGGNEAEGMKRLLAKHASGVDVVNDAMLKLLTKEQRATWAKMTGDPVPRVELLKATTAFGDANVMKAMNDVENVAAPAPAAPPPPAVPPPPPEEKK